MAGEIRWTSGSLSVALQASGTAGSIATTVATQLSGFLDNTGASGGPRLFGLVQIFAAASGFNAATNANSPIDFYMVPSRDGTKYMDVDVAGAVLPLNHYKGSFLTTVSGNNQFSLAIEAIPLLPVKYKAYIVNSTANTIQSGWGCTIDLYDGGYT